MITLHFYIFCTVGECNRFVKICRGGAGLLDPLPDQPCMIYAKNCYQPFKYIFTYLIYITNVLEENVEIPEIKCLKSHCTVICINKNDVQIL